MRYDNLALLAPSKRQELCEDLRKRTGLNVRDVEIEKIDLLRDSANLTIIYDELEIKAP